MKLYVDDLRVIPEGFVGARNYDEAIEVIEKNKGNIEILSLDHDIASFKDGKEYTGYHIVLYLCENGIDVSNIYLHTDNSVGRDNMYETLMGARRRGFLNKEMNVYKYPIVENRYEG